MPAVVVPQQQPKQPKRQSNRKSKGNDYFHKMLQLEKQVTEQRQRSTSTSPTLSAPSKHSSVDGTLQHSIAANTLSPLSPTSQDIQSAPVPAKSTDAPPQEPETSMTNSKVVQEDVKPTEPLRIETKNVSQDSINSSEICLSPSWSDHGQKERKEEKKRREKEQKEFRRRQEDDNRKPPQRLHKKPPAAMDTQKMTTELRRPRRNSLTSLLPSRSSSREPSRERPKEERRLSGVTLSSFLPGRRSSSQQRQPLASLTDDEKSPQSPDSSKPIVSQIAPRLPSFRWKRPNSEGKQSSWGEHNTSDELLGFPYEQQRQVIDKPPVDPEAEVEEPESDPIAHLAQQRTIRPMIRSSTEPEFNPKERQQMPARLEASKSLPIDPPKPAPVPKTRPLQPNRERSSMASPTSPNEQDGFPKSPAKNPRQKSDEVAAELIAMLSDNKRKPYQHVQSPVAKPYSSQAGDGGSYVHKQRMYQQQRSIAGFEEQQALQMFNEHAALAAMQADIRDVQAATKEVTKSPGRESSPSPTRSGAGSRNRSSSRARDSNRRESVSPSGRAPSQQPRQSALSPLKQVSSAPDDSDEEQERKLKQAKEDISKKIQLLQASKSEKILGFRRRTKEPPAAIQVPDDKRQSTAAKAASIMDGTQEQTNAPKQSRRDRMSAHIPFRHRRDSSGSGVAPNINGQPGNDRERSKTRSISAQLASGNAKSPNPKPSDTSTKTTPKVHRQKESTDSDESWHSTSETRPSTTSNRATSKPNAKPNNDSAAAFAASYGEGLKTPSSEEESLSDKVLAKKEKPSQELVVKGISDNGIIRKASITRPRSNPNLPTLTTTAQKIPNLDFLPELKHQPLPKSPRRQSTQTSAEPSPTTSKIKIPTLPSGPDTSYKSPLGSSSPDLALTPRSPLRPPGAFALSNANRSATSVAALGGQGKGLTAEKLEAKPIAKLFVICCKCKFWHDLPSKLYEAMALPKELHRKDDESNGKSGGKGKMGLAAEGKNAALPNGGADGKLATARLDTAVKCPWCEHAMTTWCCQGWTTVVYLHERHH